MLWVLYGHWSESGENGTKNSEKCCITTFNNVYSQLQKIHTHSHPYKYEETLLQVRPHDSSPHPSSQSKALLPVQPGLMTHATLNPSTSVAHFMVT